MGTLGLRGSARAVSGLGLRPCRVEGVFVCRIACLSSGVTGWVNRVFSAFKAEPRPELLRGVSFQKDRLWPLKK